MFNTCLSQHDSAAMRMQFKREWKVLFSPGSRLFCILQSWGRGREELIMTFTNHFYMFKKIQANLTKIKISANFMWWKLFCDCDKLCMCMRFDFNVAFYLFIFYICKIISKISRFIKISELSSDINNDKLSSQIYKLFMMIRTIKILTIAVYLKIMTLKFEYKFKTEWKMFNNSSAPTLYIGWRLYFVFSEHDGVGFNETFHYHRNEWFCVRGNDFGMISSQDFWRKVLFNEIG